MTVFLVSYVFVDFCPCTHPRESQLTALEDVLRSFLRHLRTYSSPEDLLEARGPPKAPKYVFYYGEIGNRQ